LFGIQSFSFGNIFGVSGWRLYRPIPKQKCQAGKEFFSGMAFYHLEFKTKNIFTTKKLNLPVAKLAQHTVKNSDSYLNITHE